ncbi:high mobility group nucleosome-binding domain-containing protein 5-like [Momordica charantia]|uniref:High mobility group nucleosome-binding domain-containing protein 5-like n=1 Tax=Momordica charantia TaxID=3673 RepID=A0A6J1CTN2_MOMCH|nr:high mobility group nucleosome-binding domain-containing protein 5-like [Momordica charantia]
MVGLTSNFIHIIFRLDSVKGVDSGIRNLRKAVIKKAIALQEKIDSIVAADEATDETLEVRNASDAGESGVEETPVLEDRISEHEDESSSADITTTEPADGCNELENADGVASMPLSIEKEGTIIEESMPCPSQSNVVAEVPDADDDLLKPQVPEHGVNSPYKITGEDELAEMVSEQKVPEEAGDKDMVHHETEAAEEYPEMSEVESQTDSSNSPPSSEKGIAECAAVDEREGSGNEEDHIKEEEEDGRVKGREEDGQSRELLERVVMDNKKMMEMMAQLFERNEMQTRMLCSLSHRVEQLEKAFVYETLRRKKRRNSTPVDGSGKCG